MSPISENLPKSIIYIKIDQHETLDTNDHYRRSAGSTCYGPRLRTAARFQGRFSRRRCQPLFRELLSSFCSAFNELSFAQFLQGIEHGAASQVCPFTELFFLTFTIQPPAELLFARFSAFSVISACATVLPQLPAVCPQQPAFGSRFSAVCPQRPAVCTQHTAFDPQRAAVTRQRCGSEICQRQCQQESARSGYEH